MAERSAKRLQRVLRVRTLQLDLIRAEEVRAQQKVADEQALRQRILQLAADVSPTAGSAPMGGSLSAAAHYRDRLNHSALLADRRVTTADQGLARARAATLEARRDQGAVEKLIDRAEAQATLRELRALENAPPVRKRFRHEPC